jgi:hypothetical protein
LTGVIKPLAPRPTGAVVASKPSAKSGKESRLEAAIAAMLTLQFNIFIISMMKYDAGNGKQRYIKIRKFRGVK